jgi:hypothetical protein
MLELFIPLMDRLIGLSERRETVNRGLYTDFVAPLMSNLEQLHQNYLLSFRAYADDLAKTGESLTPNDDLFGRIASDALFAAPLRARALHARRVPWDEVLSPFLNAVGAYFLNVTGPSESESDDFEPGTRNVVRSILIEDLSDIARDHEVLTPKSHRSQELLANVVSRLNASYARVSYEHEELRRRLLSPL